jgi:S-formylglutathione hydrolase FrmB
MALITFRWFSRVLEKQVETQILLPEHSQTRCATFYLLHGLSDDSTMWLRRSRIEADIANLPLIVVMPDGFRGFYTDNEAGPAFGRYIGEELVEVIDRNFPTIASREKRCIGGLSMGGYGAIRTALAYPQRFVSANSHSGALGFAARPPTAASTGVLSRSAVEQIIGTSPIGSDHDLIALAKRAKAAGTLPRLLVDCGTEDFLIEENRSTIEAWKALGIPHTYREFPGTHNWDYWSLHIKEAIAFHANAMLMGSATT